MIARCISVLAVSLLGAACATSPETDAAPGADEQALDAPVPVTVS
jgi:hypothetical protein